MKSGNKQIINVVTLDIDKCCEGKETGEWLGWLGIVSSGLWGRTPSGAYTATVPT